LLILLHFEVEQGVLEFKIKFRRMFIRNILLENLEECFDFSKIQVYENSKFYKQNRIMGFLKNRSSNAFIV